MKSKNSVITDGNEAVASIAFRVSETIAIYPITPSSPMAENCEEWAVKGKKNIWGTTPSISQLQSEGGVAGSVHGALQTGTLMTTFTASRICDCGGDYYRIDFARSFCAGIFFCDRIYTGYHG